MATIITLNPVLDITSAESLLTTLLEALSASDAITLDASHVERITTPCIQVLLAADKTAKQANQTICYARLSDAFSAAAQDLGLASYFRGDV